MYKVTPEDFKEYHRVLKEDPEKFKELCETMGAKYGLDGGALDQVFVSKGIKGEVRSFHFQESDHSMICVSVSFD